MRGIKNITAFFAFIWILSAGYAALAAGSVQVSVEPSPMELSEAGMVEMNFSVSNYSDYELHSLTISSLDGSGGIYDIGDSDLTIPASGSVSGIRIRIQVSDSQIGLPINFQVTWTQGGELMGQVVTTTVQRSADPMIQMTRTVSCESAREGEAVAFEYVLSNPTRFDMSNIVLSDEEISEMPLLQNTTLQAGSSVSIRHAFIMPASDVTSRPVVTYTALGKNKSFSSVEPVHIQFARPEIILVPTVSDPTDGGVAFTIDVRNTGNQTIQNIVLKDDQGNAINQIPFSLAAGDTETISYRVTQTTNGVGRRVSFSLTGTDPYGMTYSMETGIIAEVPPFIDPAQIITSVRAEASEPWNSASGKISILLLIQNASTVDLSNVQVYESNAGLLKTLERLSAGESRIAFDLYVPSPRDLHFTVRANDQNGTVHEIGTAELSIAYSDTKETPVPTASFADDQGNALIALFSDALTRTLAIVGIIILAAVTILIILSFSEKRRINDIERKKAEQSELDAALDYMESDDVRNETAPENTFRRNRGQHAEMKRKKQTAERDPETEMPYLTSGIVGEHDLTDRNKSFRMERTLPKGDGTNGSDMPAVLPVQREDGSVCGNRGLVHIKRTAHSEARSDGMSVHKTAGKKDSRSKGMQNNTEFCSETDERNPVSHPRTVSMPQPKVRALPRHNEIRRLKGKDDI